MCDDEFDRLLRLTGTDCCGWLGLTDCCGWLGLTDWLKNQAVMVVKGLPEDGPRKSEKDTV